MSRDTNIATSSDILLALRYGLAPADRGLVRDEGGVFWRFPPDCSGSVFL